MRTVRRNAIPMKYSLYIGRVDIVETDSDGNPKFYKDRDGNITYLTDEKREIYSTPMDFHANFSTSGGEAQDQEYGLDISDFDGVAIYQKQAYPITEGSIIWKDSEVEYDGENMYYTTDLHNLIEVHAPKKTSADYVCKKVDDSLNFTKAIFTAINK